MSQNVRVYNPNPFELVIDLVGHSIGGHSDGLARRDTLTDSLLASGALLERSAAEPPAEVPASFPEHKTRRKTNTVTTNGNGTENGEK